MPFQFPAFAFVCTGVHFKFFTSCYRFSFLKDFVVVNRSMAAKKIVLKLTIDDESGKKRALKGVAGVQGVDSVTMDMKEKKMTVIGDMDPVCLTSKLRKVGFADLPSVGPAKEEKKEGEKKEEKKEGEKKGQGEAKKENKAEPPKVVYIPMTYTYEYIPYEYTVAREEYTVVRDEYPNACAIC